MGGGSGGDTGTAPIIKMEVKNGKKHRERNKKVPFLYNKKERVRVCNEAPEGTSPSKKKRKGHLQGIRKEK